MLHKFQVGYKVYHIQIRSDALVRTQFCTNRYKDIFNKYKNGLNREILNTFAIVLFSKICIGYFIIRHISLLHLN